MYILAFIIVVAASQYITNKILNISDDNSVGYSYSKRDSLIIVAFLGIGILFQILPLKGHKLYWVLLLLYVFGILLTMIILATIKKVTITKQREELQQVFDVLEPVLPKNTELDMNNPPFKLGYEKNKINKITIQINPNTFKETVATNLCLSLNKYLPSYEWVNEFDFASRECSFIGTPLPPRVAKYQGSWLRPAEFIPLGLSGLGEVSWNINSFKNAGRSNYVYDDGRIAKTVDTPTAPQALCVGSPLGLDTIVPTTKGYKTVGTIEIGDEVFGYRRLAKVIAIYDIHQSNKLYKFTLTNENNTITLIADDVHRLAIKEDNKISPIQAMNVKKNSIVPGNNKDYIISNIEIIENAPVRCFTIDTDDHLFLFTDAKNGNWIGGNSYPFDGAYIYQTGGGKSLYIYQEIEVENSDNNV